MSTTVFPPPGATKSQQSGVLVIGANTTADVTISAVNLAKAELRFLGSKNAGALIKKLNATTLRGDNVNNGGGAEISWELTERY